MSETQLVQIVVNEDGEPCWLLPAESGGGDEWVAEVPSFVLPKLEALEQDLVDLINDAVQASGRTADGLAPVACGEWKGTKSEARHWFQIVVPASDGETWPVRDASISPHFKTEEEALGVLADVQALGGSVYMIGYGTGGDRLQRIDGASLTVERSDIRESYYDCDSCGHTFTDHEATR